MCNRVIAANLALIKLQLAMLSTKADTATPVTCTGKYDNEFPLTANAYSSSVTSLEGPVNFLADGRR